MGNDNARFQGLVSTATTWQTYIPITIVFRQAVFYLKDDIPELVEEGLPTKRDTFAPPSPFLSNLWMTLLTPDASLSAVVQPIDIEV